MKNKINIAELLKDCPKGMELDCAMFENLVFNEVDLEAHDYPIVATLPDGTQKWFTSDGRYELNPNGKCVIFPKGKTTWEGFVPPYEFKEGDIVSANIFPTNPWIGIFKRYEKKETFETYCSVDAIGNFYDTSCKGHLLKNTHPATEEEKQELFQAIRYNGYKWNPETKTLEKLPKFKVGDKIIRKHRKGKDYAIEVLKVEDNKYILPAMSMSIECQDDWELVPDKFDISTLKPFDRVLVRNINSDIWECDFFSSCNSESVFHKFHCIGAWYDECIPFDENKHLLGTTDDCDDFYKTWEE